MKNSVKRVLDLARSQIGYLEKATNKNLDDFTANAGHANYTKYARDLDAIPGFYNGKKQGVAWCDMFVDWLFVQVFGAETAKKLLCQPNNSYGAGCGMSAEYYIAKGQFHTKNPQPGDQIFFGKSHTGIVEKVDSTYVYTIEGNTSSAAGVVDNGGQVRDKKYVLGSSSIRGYGRPNWPDDEPTPAPVEPEQLPKIVANDVVKISKGAVYANSSAVPSWVIAKEWIVESVSKDVAIINKSTDGKNAIRSSINVKYLTKVESIAPTGYVPTVYEWQVAAIADGYKFPKYGADGNWGAECEAVASKAMVYKRLIGYYNRNITKIVQRVLGVEIDGKCGSETSKAIKSYQSAHGLNPDGKVGPITLKCMLNIK